MSKFNVGDKVIYIGETDKSKLRNNTGVITRLAEECGKEYDEVRFDRPLDIDEDGYEYRHYFCFARNLRKL
jgi:hypothetical protein